MKGRFKSILVIIIALAIAITTGFYLVPKDVEKTRQTTTVVRLKENIGKNQQIKEEHLDVIEIGSYNLPEYVVNNKNDILGKYATVPMHKGEFAIRKYFQDEKIPDDAFLYEDVSVDGISFETDLAKCVGGIPQKGDRVRLIIYKQAKDRETESEVLIYDELANLEVIKVANKNGISLEETQNSIDRTNNSAVPGVVTVKADIEQQQLLVKGIYDGVIHLALRPRLLTEDKMEIEKSLFNESDKETAIEEKDKKDNAKISEEAKPVENQTKTSIEKNSKNSEGGFEIDD